MIFTRNKFVDKRDILQWPINIFILIYIVLSSCLLLLYFDVITLDDEGILLTNSEITTMLTEIKSQLERARQRNKPPSFFTLDAITNLLRRLDPGFEDGVNNQKEGLICPEIFTNASYGYPHYEKGWIVNCTDKINVEHHVTLLLNPSTDGDYLQLSKRVKKSNPEMKILIGVRSGHCADIYSNFNLNNVELICFTSLTPDGKIWNDLISRVTTQYLIIGRDLDHWTWFTRLQRQLSVFSTQNNIKIVGGSARNSTGHWKVGCFQTTMANYAMEFLEGYYVSKNECMFCDHLTTPFIAKTEYFNTIRFDETLSKCVLFEDFFWRVKISDYSAVVNCPDVMYFATDIEETRRISDKTVWIDFIRMYKLNIISYPLDYVLNFNCFESNLTCGEVDESNLVPPCCLEEYTNGWRAIHDIFEVEKVEFEVVDASILGAVKGHGVLRWGLKGYAFYLPKLGFNWLNLSGIFESMGYGFEIISSFVVIQTSSGVRFELAPNNSSDYLLPVELKNISTKINVGDDVWVNSVPNPGLYARNRYGGEYLRHERDWKYKTEIEDQDLENENKNFVDCPDENFHACINKFSGDGNLQFFLPSFDFED